MSNNKVYQFKRLDQLIRELETESDSKKSIYIALDLANQVMQILGVDEDQLEEPDYILDEALTTATFKNQKMESWFVSHFRFKGARLALKQFDHEDYLIRSHFFHLNESATKARISATTQLDENWEDSELTRKPHYKVGVDFFLNAQSDSLLMVVSNNGNLRVLELSEQLSHTQREIFSKLVGLLDYDGIDSKTGERIEFEPQKSIHKTLWEALSIETVNKSFYVTISDLFNELTQFIQDNPPTHYSQGGLDAKAKIFSIRLLGRILFLWFLRKKEVLDESQNYFDVTLSGVSKYYEEILKPLFFQTLNEPIESRSTLDVKTPYLNGGLFSPHDDDMVDFDIHFPENWFTRFYNHLNKFNFTVDESSPEYEQVAIDPEMLGRVFENLLATINPETSKNARKEKGAFYTPRTIVSYMSKIALKEHIISQLDNEKDRAGVEMLIDMNDAAFLERKSTGSADLWGKNRSPEISKKIIQILNEMKILDPAVGSGAFPIGMMQLIIRTYDRLNAIYDEKINHHRLGTVNETLDLYHTKLSIIQNNLYGIDIEPMAIEIARLRAWLSLIIDEKESIEPLPNLELSFVCANSLIPLKKDVQMNIFADNQLEERMEKLRNAYFNAHSYQEKEKLKNEFYSLNQSNENDDEQSRQLRTWNPFSFKAAEFFDTKKMFNTEGFDIVIGNPPYIHLEKIKKLSKELYKPIGYQTYEARGDIYTLFFEMGVNNLNSNGYLCFITSNKWMRAGYGASFRKYLNKYTQAKLLVDLGSGVFQNATVDTNILLISNSPENKEINAVTLDKNANDVNLDTFIKANVTEQMYKSDEPWTILSPIERSIKEKIERYGTPLKDWPNIEIKRGILTGLNEAFIIDEKKRQKILDGCKNSDERLNTDKIIKPVLRGKDVKTNKFNWANLYLINFHNGYKSDNTYIEPLKIKKYPSLKIHFDRFEPKLSSRTDQGITPYNLRDCSYLIMFNKKKIIFPAIMSKGPLLALDNDDFFVLAPGNIISGENLDFVIDFINQIGYFSLRKFYLGGGIEGEIKVNRLEKLPVPLEFSYSKDICLITQAKKYYNFTDVEIKLINEFNIKFGIQECV